jgi:hypothetical protein
MKAAWKHSRSLPTSGQKRYIRRSPRRPLTACGERFCSTALCERDITIVKAYLPGGFFHDSLLALGQIGTFAFHQQQDWTMRKASKRLAAGAPHLSLQRGVMFATCSVWGSRPRVCRVRFYRFDALSSRSMTSLNAANGWAPRSEMPLMKNVGVPFTSAFMPSSKSAWTC